MAQACEGEGDAVAPRAFATAAAANPATTAIASIADLTSPSEAIVQPRNADERITVTAASRDPSSRASCRMPPLSSA
jgi:hypothetical protein